MAFNGILQRESSNFSEPQIIDGHESAYSTFNCKPGAPDVAMLLDNNAGPVTYPQNSFVSSGEINIKENNLGSV